MSANPLSRDPGTERLSARRKRGRRRVFIALGILLLIALGCLFWWLWQPSSRISSVTVFGGDPSLANYARDVMAGTYFHLVPRDSAFFYPAHQIRTALLAAHPDIAAVSLFREGLTSLSIKVIARVPIARWCGIAPTEGVEPYCYIFDSSGIIYAAASTTDPVLNSFALYEPLAASSTEPLGAIIANANQLPAAFDFARKLATLGGQVSSVVIRGDEVDDLVASSTRVTYVLGQEQAAYAALLSAQGDYTLSDGSLAYIDLRFPGKIYIKRKGE